jgi:hypothetical protein
VAFRQSGPAAGLTRNEEMMNVFPLPNFFNRAVSGAISASGPIQPVFDEPG